MDVPDEHARPLRKKVFGVSLGIPPRMGLRNHMDVQ
jgi:hypothetical protein